MKTLIAIFLSLVLVSAGVSQTAINKTVPLRTNQQVRMHFDYPELIRVSTWEKNEISIQGSVSINGGENDDAFELIVDTQGNYVDIRNRINHMEDLPQRITVMDGGEKLIFRNKSEWRKYREENPGSHSTINQGVDMDILIDIKVPKGVETLVESTYGIVEVKNFTGPLTVAATYGGVDAALVERNTGELIAETNYGQIYSNLDLKIDAGNTREEDFHTYVSARPGTGPHYRFESQYGNVYLRKGN